LDATLRVVFRSVALYFNFVGGYDLKSVKFDAASTAEWSTYVSRERVVGMEGSYVSVTMS